MASPKPFDRFRTIGAALTYAAAVALFLSVCAQFYLPGYGFTDLVMFGDRQSAHYLPELKRTNYYLEQDSFGYDAQYYAQIAMHPQLGDRTIHDAVDSLPYRARRILFCWTAYAFGAGDPVAALHVFSIQNIVAWLVLAAVLLRWFPPDGLENFIRWAGVMFTFGLCFSVRGSLVDGPSLLLIAVGMLLLETGRPWWSAAVLGIAGLGKETNILAGAALAPAHGRARRGWIHAIGRGLLIVAPLAAWLLCLKLWLGNGGDLGARNFDWPFAGYVRKWREALAPFFGPGSGVIGRAEVLVMAAMSAQWLFFVLRPRWRDPWWRVGAGYAALMIVLGDAVWEGYPGAASRVLLPMTLAFNVSLPRGRRWWPLLILGNLLVWPSADVMVPPGRVDTQVFGPQDLRTEASTGDRVRVTFDAGQWYGTERSRFEYWRWTRGPASITLHNPHPYPLFIEARFQVKSTDERTITLRQSDRVLWHGKTEKPAPEVTLHNVELPSGDTDWRFEADRPPLAVEKGDSRALSYRVCNLEIFLREPPGR